MKYLKTYKIFESKNEEVTDTFSSIIYAPKIVTIPTKATNKTDSYTIGRNFNIYVVYGGRAEQDEHNLLKELYYYREPIKNNYNMDYFRIILRDNKVIIILKDYIDKNGNYDSPYDGGSEYYLRYLKTSILRDSTDLPREIYDIIMKDEFKGHSTSTPEITSGIYTDKGSSNLSLFKWQYEKSNEGIRSGLAKAGLVGSLLMSSPDKSISSPIKTEQTQDSSELYNNIKEISNIRKSKSKDKMLSVILSEMEENLSSNDSTKFIELFNKLSSHIESKYGYKISNKKVEELTESDISELKNGSDGITLISILGWLGSICLAICGLPQAWLSYKDRHSHGISWSFLILWAFGEIFALAYVYDKLDLPLLLNYSVNILILSVILFYKIKPNTIK